ncbi:MAG: G-D-S-L family lipolytic protein [Bacteroidales bacterium]|nr:G-D-S-L family lipolytic protein [Bacteroidales bacterium]
MKRVLFSMVALSVILFSCNLNSRKDAKSESNSIAKSKITFSNDSTSAFNVFNYFPQREIKRYGAEVEKYAKQDSVKFPGRGKVLFVGSSSIRKWTTLQHDMEPIQVINRGFGGSTFPELIYYVNQLIFKYDPKIVVIYEGDNDQLSLTPMQIKANADYLDSLIHEKLPETKIIFLSVKPSPARRDKLQSSAVTNDYIKKLCQSNDYTYYGDVWSAMFDKNGKIKTSIFSPDSLHMNVEGYKIWTRIIKNEIENIEKQ